MSKVKQPVIISVVGPCSNLRTPGEDLATGMKLSFHVNGEKKEHKVYMVNDGNFLSCYIKLRGVNRILRSPSCGTEAWFTPYSLERLSDWYIELN